MFIKHSRHEERNGLQGLNGVRLAAQPASLNYFSHLINDLSFSVWLIYYLQSVTFTKMKVV